MGNTLREDFEAFIGQPYETTRAPAGSDLAGQYLKPHVQLAWEAVSHMVNLVRDDETGRDSAVAAIGYALNNQGEEPMAFLHCWYYGNFNEIRKEWENVPDEVFIDAEWEHPGTQKRIKYYGDM